jgi:hypothetical protein
MFSAAACSLAALGGGRAARSGVTTHLTPALSALKQGGEGVPAATAIPFPREERAERDLTVRAFPSFPQWVW